MGFKHLDVVRLSRYEVLATNNVVFEKLWLQLDCKFKVVYPCRL